MAVYAIEGGEEFADHAAHAETHLDVVLGVVFIVLLLEATRRTTGWIVPCVAMAFMAYPISGGRCLPGAMDAPPSCSSSSHHP